MFFNAVRKMKQTSPTPRQGTLFSKLRYFYMMRANELATAAEQYEKRADRTIDPSFARALRQRACQLRDMALEVDLLQRDPLYRTIHDRPDHIVAR